MAVQFRLAALGHTMEKGRVVEWLVPEGGRVQQGEPLLSVETDKAVIDVESPANGVLLRIIGQVDEEYPVGAALAWIGEENEDIPDQEPSEEPADQPPPPAPRGTPVARRLAERHGIDADALEGSGPGGRVTKEDVQRAVDAGEAARKEAAADTAPEGVEIISLTGLRRTAAERLSASWAQTPQVTLAMEVDFTACLAARAANQNTWRETFGVVPTINDLVLKATAETLRSHPQLNSALIDGAVHRYQDINLGVAIDVAEGLIVPVLHRADSLSLGEIASTLRGLTQRARQGKLGLGELQGATFTVSNLGGMGIDWFTPVLNPPQCAILGVGRVRRMAVPDGDKFVARDLVHLVLSFDHRVVDGAPCARFLADLRELIETPDSWLG